MPTVFAEIRSDEIPDVPFQKFLYRGKQEEASGDANKLAFVLSLAW